jgi:hypothetical protein
MASCRRATVTAPLAGAVLALVVLLPAAVSGQNADGEDTYYSRYTDFKIPFKASDPRIREVILNASEDQGRNWKPVATSGPGGDGFRFSARRDGWYYFTVQTRDTDNRLYPPTLDGAKPGLKVCVDTQPPIVRLEAIAPREGGVGVKWDVRDDNLDLRTIQVEYRAAGTADWTRLEAQRIAAGQHIWNPGTNLALEVRLLVRDLAGNEGKAATSIAAGERPRYTGGQLIDDSGPRARPAAAPSNVRYVNSNRISLNFDVDNVGKSGVSVIELWSTRDGTSWNQEQTQNKREPPFVFEVAGEGRYGFTLIARSGVGMGDPPPRLGDPPQIWVEVDTTKPVVHLEKVDVGRGLEAGNLTIRYKASDRNITDRPISLSYAEKPDGTWTPIAKNEENTGRYVWKMPADVPYQLYVRVEAVDKAGNVGSDETGQPIAVDLSQPKVRVIDVTPANK